ncbi:DUF1254 domain-containing protein [Dyella kyungheensis]|uniref:DUF1254 domain-containing protein n=1 Tax=Dyella kyungheensis TaxID=1242174 RepID=UPI003CF283ED
MCKAILSIPCAALLLFTCRHADACPTADPTSPMEAAQVPAATSAQELKGTPPGTVMTKGYVQAVGRMAYIWGWPLVNNYNRSQAVAKVPRPGLNGGILPVSPPGAISMLTDYIKPDQNFITCPNQDTVYGAGYQHVDTQPVVVQVPDFGERFYVYQIADARTDSFCAIGKQYKSKPGFYLIVGPNWKGDVPKGITEVCRSTTDLVTVLPRAFMDDTAEDKAAIQKVLSQIVVYPLDKFDGKMKTMDWHKLPIYPVPASMGGGEIHWVEPEKFFDELPVVMKQIPPQPGEESLYAMIESVLDAAGKDASIKQTLVQTAVDADREIVDPLFEFRNNGRPIGNGWTSPSNGARWGVDYLSRTATAKSNMYDNAPQETRYIYTDFDAKGTRLSGAGGNAYTITFPKGQTPPVSGFWSLTMYNKHHFFEPNALSRFSVGTKNKNLKTNADGSLTIYVQHESPGKDRESNWLPAPSDAFSLYIRAYWPEAPIIDGTWAPPPVVKAR